MRQYFVHRSIGFRIFLISGVLFLSTAAAVVVLVNRYMRMEALSDARLISQVIVDRSLATHTYFSHQLKPDLFPLVDAVNPPSYFDPVWMSSTYAVREIQKYFQALGNDAYYYKECAINARSPENEADPTERDFIHKINNDSGLTFDVRVRRINGQPFYVVLRRGEVMEAACLRCHSTPDKAPADLVSRYGNQRSFHRQADEVVSAISIRIPLARAYADANRFSWILSLILLSLLVVLFGLQFWSVRRTVCKPIDTIVRRMEETAGGRAPLDTPLVMPPGKELRILAQAFNTMSRNLYDYQNHLEERIRQRTEELTQANAELEKEVHQRQEMITRLAESESRYRSLFDHMLSGFALHEVLTDPQGRPSDYRFLEVNPSFETMTGLKRDLIVGQKVTQVLPGIERDPADWIGTYGQVALTGQTKRFEQFAAPLNRWFLVSVFSHQKGFFATIFIDITAQKKLERDLRESEEKYRSMMESMTDPAYICSPDHRISYINPAMATIVGHDAVGKPCHEILHERQEPCHDCALKEVKAGRRRENELVLAQNQRHYHAVHSPIFHSDGSISKIAIYRDITDKIAMEAQLRQAQKMEAVATLTGGIAHDFNNILGIILGNAELAMEDVPEWNPARFQLGEIRTASLRGREVVRQLLSFSRKSKEERKPLHLAPLIKEALQLMRASLPADIAIDQHFEADLAPVLADATQIHQIVMNLCTNAFHAMEEKGGTLRVILEKVAIEMPVPTLMGELAPGAYIRLCVTDTGCGIAPENLMRVFDPYYTTKEPDRGSGLGLAVVLGIVKSHDGGIMVHSAPGEGTTFEIYLHPVAGAVTQEVPEAEAIPGGKERILAVDDEVALLQLTAAMLTRIGYAVSSFSDPEEALEQVRNTPNEFDLILSDLTMPRMTGDRLITEIHAIRPDIPVVLCTGNANRMNHVVAQLKGVIDWVTKPLRMRDLAVVVRRTLDKGKTRSLNDD